MKICSSCHIEKSLTEFHRKGKGYISRCKVCRKAGITSKVAPIATEHGRVCIGCGIMKSWPEFGKSKNDFMGHMARCKECRNKNRRKSERKKGKRQTKRQMRSTVLYRTYGITIEDYDKMVEGQNGVCAICGNGEIQKSKSGLCIDHDHETGKVRGLLCSSCNSALGLFKDSTETLENAMAYLKK